MADFDLAIRGGQIMDGSGGLPFTGDVYVLAGRIARVATTAGDVVPCPARTEVDASGMVVCPGFIDIHSHSDKSLLINPLAESKVRQGVTTEVIGNCGSSLVPLSQKNRGGILKDLDEYNLEIPLAWEAPGDYLEALSSLATSVNVVALLGHGALRSSVMGYDMAQPSTHQMAEMKSLVGQAIREGFAGLSTGLIYPPGIYATTAELVELASEAGRHGGFYATHIRGEREQLPGAIAEAIAVGREAGLPVQISHLKAAGRPNWGSVREVLRSIERARSAGLDVAADQYPYTASATSLGSILPSWAHDGGREATIARLRDPHVRARIEAEVEAREGAMQGWEEISIAGVATPENQSMVGRFLVDIARERGVKPASAVASILLEEQMAVSMIRFSLSEDDVREIMSMPYVMIGSDGTALAPYGHLAAGRPHPRSYGTFPRVLGRYAVTEGVITLREAIRKMTSLPASRLGLRDRGLLKPGFAADIVVFDPVRVGDTATFENPARFPDGIGLVVVNGHVTVRDGAHTGARKGEVLRGGGGSTL